MNTDNHTKICCMMEMPYGIIYITGPTRDGKTTTLHMILETPAKRQVNIAAIEDPAEKNIGRVDQMQIDTMAGLTLERGLRALLRQGPNIILVGETHDAETVSISMRAAITGHLVLNSLHINDAISSIARLGDTEIEPYLIASSLVGNVSQRLVRTICPHYREELGVTQLERQVLGKKIEYVYRGTGCHHCNQTDYKGRTAVHEIILIDKEMRRMISSHRDIDNIYAYVKKSQQLHTLKDETVELVISGQTTVGELYKITAYSD